MQPESDPLVEFAQFRFISFAAINLRRDLHPQECVHADRTNMTARVRGRMPPKTDGRRPEINRSGDSL